jgi:hypothetical protein
LSHEQENAVESGDIQKIQAARKRVTGAKSAYLWGAVSGIALAVFAPMLRPAAKSAVKSGIKLGRYAKKVGSNLKEEFEDIAAEAQADLNRESPSGQPPRES